MSFVERSFILCPFLGGSTIGGFTVFIIFIKCCNDYKFGCTYIILYIIIMAKDAMYLKSVQLLLMLIMIRMLIKISDGNMTRMLDK